MIAIAVGSLRVQLFGGGTDLNLVSLSLLGMALSHRLGVGLNLNRLADPCGNG